MAKAKNVTGIWIHYENHEMNPGYGTQNMKVRKVSAPEPEQPGEKTPTRVAISTGKLVPPLAFSFTLARATPLARPFRPGTERKPRRRKHSAGLIVSRRNPTWKESKRSSKPREGLFGATKKKTNVAPPPRRLGRKARPHQRILMYRVCCIRIKLKEH